MPNSIHYSKEKLEDFTNLLNNKKAGEILKVDKEGNLCRVSSFWGKLWFIIVDFCTANGKTYRVAFVVNNIGLQILQNLQDTEKQKEAFGTIARDFVDGYSKISQHLMKKSNRRVAFRTVLNEQEMNVASVFLAIATPVSKEEQPQDQINRVDQECQKLFKFASESSFPLTHAPLREKYQQIFHILTGVEKLSEAKKKYPNVESVEKLVEAFEFPELAEARIGIKKKSVRPIKKGISGTYVLYDRKGQAVGVFKPDDQTVGGINNPKGATIHRVNADLGLTFTDFSIREKVAYEMDRNFAGVPHTDRVTLKDIKFSRNLFAKESQGSFHAFMHGAIDAIDLWRERNKRYIITNLPLREIHKVAIQDIRWLNADRHLGNLMIDRKREHVVPIDHGCILPTTAERLVFNWMSLSQSALPLGEEEFKYIEDLDPEKDAGMLRKNGIEESAVERMKIATYLMKKAVKKGLSLRDIGHLMISGPEKKAMFLTRTLPNNPPSYFEKTICERILKKHEDRDKVLDEVVTEYYNNYLFASKSLGKGWKKQDLEGGIALLSFDGKMQTLSYDTIYRMTPQRIRVLMIPKTKLTEGYNLEVVLTRELAKDQSDGVKQRQTISQVSEKMPNMIAAVNGGFFHYRDMQTAQYHWEGFFEEGDPVGTSVINGKQISKNPVEDLWGTFNVYANRTIGIVEDQKEKSSGQDVLHALGAAPVLLRNGRLNPLEEKTDRVAKKVFGKIIAPGEFQRHIHTRQPRTAIAMTEDAVLLVTVDGRLEGSSGMTGEQLADFLRRYGAVQALNLDGGGSTQMWVKPASAEKGFTANNPSDGKERPVVSMIALVKKEA